MTGGPPEYSMPEHSQRRTNGQWPTFFIMLGILGAMGLVVCYLLILPMAMMTDGCHEGSLEWQCRLSGRGQNAALLIPFACLAVGVASALAGAWLSARFRRSPLLGIPIGILAGWLMIHVGAWMALQV